MNENFVTFEVSKKLKEKGFPLVDYIPTISQVLKWLREEKKMHIQIIVYGNGWYFETWQYDEISAAFRFQGIDCDSYEQAAIAGIEYVLDNLI